jgi:hypothetical protein
VRRAIPCFAAAAAALTCALAATPALAGQIVWLRAAGSSGGAVWAANDDGTYPHRLVAAGNSQLAAQFPGGTLADPDIFQNGGSTVLFTDTEGAFAAPGGTGLCTNPCTNVVSLASGVLSAPLPAPPATGAAFATQPRLARGGALVTQYALYPSASPTTLGSATTQGIFEGPAGASSFGLPWADTATEAMPLRADAAPDPANASLVAWVENQDPSCTRFAVNGAPVCQYAIHVAQASATASPPVAIFDDEAPPGSGPSSLAWSSDGRNLLIVDDQPPNDGIYEVPASTSAPAAGKQVKELIAEPPGWIFGQARFAGSKVVFDARGEGHSTPNTSDIYAISAKCDSGTCSFPDSATNLTSDAAADNIGPAWSSAAAPLPALGAAPVAGAAPKLDAAKIVSRTVTAKTGVSFEVTLSVAGSLSVSISRHGHTIGTTTLHLAAGASTVTIKQPGGHALTTGTDEAKLRVGGSTAVRYATTFTVRPAPRSPTKSAP